VMGRLSRAVPSLSKFLALSTTRSFSLDLDPWLIVSPRESRVVAAACLLPLRVRRRCLPQPLECSFPAHLF